MLQQNLMEVTSEILSTRETIRILQELISTRLIVDKNSDTRTEPSSDEQILSAAKTNRWLLIGTRRH